jgi:hypothetical protein
MSDEASIPPEPPGSASPDGDDPASPAPSEPEAGPATPAPEASAATQPRAALGPGFELPTARQVVGRGLQLAYDSTREIRRGSLYIGLLLLGTVGPFVCLLLADFPRLAGIPFDNPQSMTLDQELVLFGLIVPLYGSGILAVIGLVTVGVDSTLICIALLGGRAAGRPLTLRESVARARQVFWRYAIAAFLVGIVSFGVTLVVELLTGSLGAGSLGASLLASFVGALAVLPFGYIATAVVIGDVGATAALGRSIRLMRARVRLALAVAAFAFAASALQTFGLGAALGVVEDVAQILHLSLDLNGPGLIVGIILAAVGLVAVGSLLFTVDSIAVAPQVTAFLGLTHFAGGLDRARTPIAPPAALAEPPSALAAPPPPAASPLDPPFDERVPVATSELRPPQPWAAPAPRPSRPTRWVTIPMIGLIVLESLVAAAGLANAVSAGPVPSSDLLLRVIDAEAGSGRASLAGPPTARQDPLGDQSGGHWRQGDLKVAAYASVREVPPWVLDDLFAGAMTDRARVGPQPAPSSSRRASSMPRWWPSSWRTVRRTSSSRRTGSG